MMKLRMVYDCTHMIFDSIDAELMKRRILKSYHVAQ